MEATEQEFHQAMIDGYYEMAKLGYRATYFLRMVQELGGLQAAKQLISKDNVTEGFSRLWEMGRLDLSVEAFVLQPKYRHLFTAEELQHARRHLEAMGYMPPDVVA